MGPYSYGPRRTARIYIYMHVATAHLLSDMQMSTLSTGINRHAASLPRVGYQTRSQQCTGEQRSACMHAGCTAQRSTGTGGDSLSCAHVGRMH